MEKLSVRKNVYLGLCMLDWLFALIMMVTDKTQVDREAKRIYVSSIVMAIALTICGCIPFLGWILAIPVTIFYIIAIVQTFKGNYYYKIPIFNGIIEKFANK